MRSHRFLLLLLLFATPLFALEVPPPPTRWMTDAADILSVTEESILDKKLEEFEQQTGAQFIIYIFPSIEGESIEEFAIRSVERWKVGQKKYDNGLVLFVFVKERKVRVEVGKGLEGTITDAVSSRVIREQIAPHFQRADYSAGLNAAADELMRRIRTGEQPVQPLQRSQRGVQPGQGSDINPVFILVILFVVFFIVVPMLTRRRSGCGGCTPLFFFPGGGGGTTFGGGGFSGGGGFGGGGFSGGGGSFGGGGATGGW